LRFENPEPYSAARCADSRSTTRCPVLRALVAHDFSRDAGADAPIGEHHRRVDHARELPPRGIDQRAHVAEEPGLKGDLVDVLLPRRDRRDFAELYGSFGHVYFCIIV
jgi:hypothetical protein